MTALTIEERGEQKRKTGFCSYCLGRLPDGFFFTCAKCGATCCYIHMSRHQPSRCKARKGPRRTRTVVLVEALPAL